jgi:hypothetical protein
MKKQLLICAAAALALSTAVYEAASTVPAPTMPAQARVAGLSAGEPIRIEPQTAAIGGSDPLAIREAHSDGGYWYWEERRPAPARIELAAKPR